MGDRLNNKVALITGGTSGIGAATAELFIAEGAKVAIAGRSEEKGQALADTLGEQAIYIKCDVTNEDDIAATVARTSEHFGGLNILFNNAGGGGGGDFPNSSTEEWNHVINVNLNGTFYVSRAVWPHLVEAGGGAVVNMSSLAAQRGFSPRMYDEFGTTAPSYYAAKAGVDALTRYMAGVGGKHNIRINCVRPGQIMTPGATRGTLKDPDGGHHVFEKMFDMTQIIPGPGYPEDVANLVLFLVSDESRFITGEIINVDGGVAAKI